MQDNINRNEYLKKIINDEYIKKEIISNNLTKVELLNNFNVLLAYYLKKEKCENCNLLENCKQSTKGYKPSISYNGVNFAIDYIPCQYKQKVIDQKKLEKNLICYSCNFDMFNFDDVYVDGNRKEILSKIKLYLDNNNLPTKGLYLNGKFGSGKTYILAYLAKKMADSNHKVIFAYYPDLVRVIKSSITTGKLEDIVEELKEIEVLFLDDFGGETLTNFIRDEILGAILQDRMSNQRLTFMSSNLDKQLLLEHLSESAKETDKTRASRIYERIASLMDFIELKDKDYRL